MWKPATHRVGLIFVLVCGLIAWPAPLISGWTPPDRVDEASSREGWEPSPQQAGDEEQIQPDEQWQDVDANEEDAYASADEEGEGEMELLEPAFEPDDEEEGDAAYDDQEDETYEEETPPPEQAEDEDR